VRTRTNKGDFSRQAEAAIETLHGAGGLERLRIAEIGWIDQHRVDGMYRDMRERFAAGDEGYTDHVFPLWMIAGMNQWFEATVGGASANAGRYDDERTERQSAAG